MPIWLQIVQVIIFGLNVYVLMLFFEGKLKGEKGEKGEKGDEGESRDFYE